MKVVKVKKSDKGDFYKRQQTWELRDLTEVDAKDASKVRKMTECLYFVTCTDVRVQGASPGRGCSQMLCLSHHFGLFPFPGLKPNFLYAEFK